VVGVPTDKTIREVRISAKGRDFSFPNHADRPWGPFSLVFNAYRDLFPRGLRLATHLHIRPTLRMSGALPPFPYVFNFTVYKLHVGGNKI